MTNSASASHPGTPQQPQELDQRVEHVRRDLAATYASLTDVAEAHAPCFEPPARNSPR